MASYYPCVKNHASGYIFYISLISQASTKIAQVNPTLAAGDVKIAIDDGAPNNMGTLPAVDADFTKRVKVTLSQAETNGDNLTIIFSDAAGAEWCDLTINIQTVPRRFDDLAYPATSGRSMVVDTAGLVDANTVKVGPTGAGAAQTARDIGASVLLSAGSGAGQLDFASGVVKANLAQILGTALTESAGQIANAFKQFFNIASPTSTMNLVTTVTTATNVTNDVGITQTGADKVWGTTARALTDKVNFALSSAGLQAIWDVLTSALITGSSIGKLLVDNINATISSRSTITTAEVNAEADTALADINLDHLVGTATGIPALPAGTYIDQVKTKTDTLPSDPADESLLEAAIAAVQADTDNIQTRLPAALVGGRIDASVGAMGADVIGDAQLGADVDTYQAKVQVLDDNAGAADHYVVSFFKNGQPVYSGVTDPTLQVIKASDGTNLIAITALTQIAATGLYRLDETTNRMVSGAAYVAKTSATIDGSARTWPQPIGRDSSA